MMTRVFVCFFVAPWVACDGHMACMSANHFADPRLFALIAILIQIDDEWTLARAVADDFVRFIRHLGASSISLFRWIFNWYLLRIIIPTECLCVRAKLLFFRKWTSNVFQNQALNRVWRTRRRETNNLWCNRLIFRRRQFFRGSIQLGECQKAFDKRLTICKEPCL